MHAELPRFAGSEQHALDHKGRLIVPARFRERLDPQFVLTIAHPDPCLALYPTATWIEFCGRLEAVPGKDERYRRYVRYLFAHTEEVACDAQGRVVVPALLRAYAGHRTAGGLDRPADADRDLGAGPLRVPNAARGRGPRLHGRARPVGAGNVVIS